MQGYTFTRNLLWMSCADKYWVVSQTIVEDALAPALAERIVVLAHSMNCRDRP